MKSVNTATSIGTASLVCANLFLHDVTVAWNTVNVFVLVRIKVEEPIVLEEHHNVRDPERIPRILGKLQKVWSVSYDQRFGQLVLNLYGAHFMEPSTDFFYAEDDKFECILDDIIAGKRSGW